MTSTNKAIELQLQVKQNAEELQDFMRDLENWEKDIKQKDMELRRQSGVPEEVNFLIKFLLYHPAKLFILKESTAF